MVIVCSALAIFLVEKTFRIPCAWRSTLSDTIDREIYHRKNETIAGGYYSLQPLLKSE